MIESDYRLSIKAILNPSEVFDVVDNMLTAADGVISADPASFERKLFVATAEANQVLARAVGTGQTPDSQRAAKDEGEEKRDSGFKRVKNTVNDIVDDQQEDDQALKNAAALINEVLADYPANLHNTPLSENTILLESLIPKLQAEPAASAVATLGLTRFVDRMQEGNEQYKQAVAASAADRAENVPQDWDAAKPVRWLGSHLASTIAFLGATDAAYAPLAAQVRQFIDDAEARARARQTRRTSGGGDDAPATESDG